MGVAAWPRKKRLWIADLAVLKAFDEADQEALNSEVGGVEVRGTERLPSMLNRLLGAEWPRAIGSR